MEEGRGSRLRGRARRGGSEAGNKGKRKREGARETERKDQHGSNSSGEAREWVSAGAEAARSGAARRTGRHQRQRLRISSRSVLGGFSQSADAPRRGDYSHCMPAARGGVFFHHRLSLASSLSRTLTATRSSARPRGLLLLPLLRLLLPLLLVLAYIVVVVVVVVVDAFSRVRDSVVTGASVFSIVETWSIRVDDRSLFLLSFSFFFSLLSSSSSSCRRSSSSSTTGRSKDLGAVTRSEQLDFQSCVRVCARALPRGATSILPSSCE